MRTVCDSIYYLQFSQVSDGLWEAAEAGVDQAEDAEGGDEAGHASVTDVADLVRWGEGGRAGVEGGRERGGR